jgi:hypothetical protein
VKEDFDVLQRVGGRTAYVWGRSLSAQRLHYAGFVQLTVDPCQIAQTRRGQGTDLAVIVLE